MQIGPTETYKRNQVEWALWSFFSITRYSVTPSIPRVFRTRIKRLLEIDRAAEYEEAVERAFIDVAPEGTGTDLQYTRFNVFTLSVALDLLDAGFPQAEIVFLLRHSRKDLEIEFEEMLPKLPRPRGRLTPDLRPGCPTYVLNGRKYADCRRFMIVEKLDMKEIYPGDRDNYPLIRQPIFAEGIDQLKLELDGLNHRRRKALVLELANGAALLLEYLAKAPLVTRGRK
jgi:hypothetical protein